MKMGRLVSKITSIIVPVLAWMFVVSASLVLSACGGQALKPAVSPALTEPRDEQQSRQAVLVAQLLYEANEALLRNRLTKPAYDNAYDRYQKVLRIDPANDSAKTGIKRIGRRYLSLAKEADRRGDRAKARHYVGIAATVDPDYPAIAHMRAYLSVDEEKKTSAANVYYLSRSDLAARNAAIKSQLGDIARRAQGIDSRLLIVGSNDAESRWIYQQMRSATSNYRLRGNIERGARPKVVLLDAPLQAGP